MAPSSGSHRLGHRRRSAQLRRRRAVADAVARPGQLHVPKVDVLVSTIFRSQPNVQPAGDHRRHQWRFPNRQLPDDTGTVPDGDGRAAAAGLTQQAVICWRRAPSTAIASMSWTCGSRSAAVRPQAAARRTGPLQPVQRQPANGLREVYDGHQRRPLDAADSRPQPAGGAVQRAVRLLMTSMKCRGRLQAAQRRLKPAPASIAVLFLCAVTLAAQTVYPTGTTIQARQGRAARARQHFDHARHLHACCGRVAPQRRRGRRRAIVRSGMEVLQI